MSTYSVGINLLRVINKKFILKMASISNAIDNMQITTSLWYYIIIIYFHSIISDILIHLITYTYINCMYIYNLIFTYFIVMEFICVKLKMYLKAQGVKEGRNILVSIFIFFWFYGSSFKTIKTFSGLQFFLFKNGFNFFLGFRLIPISTLSVFWFLDLKKMLTHLLVLST